MEWASFAYETDPFHSISGYKETYLSKKVVTSSGQELPAFQGGFQRVLGRGACSLGHSFRDVSAVLGNVGVQTWNRRASMGVQILDIKRPGTILNIQCLELVPHSPQTEVRTWALGLGNVWSMASGTLPATCREAYSLDEYQTSNCNVCPCVGIHHGHFVVAYEDNVVGRSKEMFQCLRGATNCTPQQVYPHLHGGRVGNTLSLKGQCSNSNLINQLYLTSSA
uniref:Uncharacterized protein n=1 Tax=Timema bartmani TaxID=61472 RepID=A0A7R9F7X7_9NEOP|nr:unnamed protein product [Timema bartmani]